MSLFDVMLDNKFYRLSLGGGIKPMKIRCFVAYPMQPARLPETLEEGLRIISLAEVEFEPWRTEMEISGRILRNVIFEEKIKEAPMFGCDLSGLNFNVLFELGFAIGTGKRIWAICAEDDKHLLEKFRLLRQLGYVSYINSRQIQEHYHKEMPHETLDRTLRHDLIPSETLQLDETVLYLKSPRDTDDSLKLSRALEELNTFTDDPAEGYRPLEWYAEKIFRSSAAVFHLLSDQDKTGMYHNAKCSLLAGLAHSLGKETLMLAHEPFRSPIDYDTLLQTHNTPSQCLELIRPWIDTQKRARSERRGQQQTQVEHARRANLLHSISIGDYVAENEVLNLEKYFVPTEFHKTIIESGNSLVVGRKGTGKTASLIMLEKELSPDLHNVMCTIRPVNYDLEALIELLASLKNRSERGNMLESVWKFLLTTEIAKVLLQELNSRLDRGLSPDENELLKVAKRMPHLVQEDLSARLNALMEILAKEAVNDRIKVSESIHTGPIKELRDRVSAVLKGKGQVYFLIDNLDKSWSPQNNLNLMAEFIFALLGASQRLIKDLGGNSRRDPLGVHMVVFLRTDIYSYILDSAREQDKMPIRDIDWNDEELLLRVIEERLLVAAQFHDREKVWKELICDSVEGIPVKTWLMKQIVPRPRDLIFLVATAIKKAAARQHSNVNADDLKDAADAYSEFALGSLIVEAKTVGDWMENVVYGFVDCKHILTFAEAQELVEIVKQPDLTAEQIILLLMQLSFFGYEVDGEDQFRFEYGILDRKKLTAKWSKQQNAGRAPRLMINRPFRRFLDIKTA